MTGLPATSKAALMTEFGKPLEIREIPVPQLEPGAILVKNEMAGLCGSDLHLWRGTSPLPITFPFLMGHETIGRIEKLGEGREKDVTGKPLKAGDRIFHEDVGCGECWYCEINHSKNLCLSRHWQGCNCSDEWPYITGGLSEYSYVFPKSDVVKIPEELTNEEAIGVGCAMMSVMHGWRNMLGGLKTFQDTVVILGSGPLGLYASLLAKEGGAAKTIVIGAPQNRLELARRWGADHTINIDDKSPEERIKEVYELTDGLGADVVIEVAGPPQAFLDALEMVRKGGRILEHGVTVTDPLTFTPSTIIFKQITILGSAHAQIEDIWRGLQFIKTHKHKYPFSEIVSNKYALDQVTEALLAMEEGKEIKPVIVF